MRRIARYPQLGGNPNLDTVLAPINTAIPTFSGTAQVGQTLTKTSDGTWTNTPTSFSYQWKRSGADIAGANGTTYVQVATDVGGFISLSVTATNSFGPSLPSDSAATVSVIDIIPTNTAAPTISDTTPQEGQTLTATNGTWANNPTNYTYLWKSAGVLATGIGATSTNYITVTADVGNPLAVEVTAYNTGGTSAPAPSTATAAVTSSAVPSNTVAPSISGIGQVGQVLTGNDGGWAGTPTSYTRKWKRNGIAVGGATATIYTATASDIAQQLTYEVIASNANGPSAPAANIISPFGIYNGVLGGGADMLIIPGTTREINHAHLSPNGAFIAFVKYYIVNSGSNATEGADYRDTEILIYEVATGVVTVLVTHNPATISANPVWWPDMSKIIFITTNTTTNPGKAGIGQFIFSPGLPNPAGTFSVLYNPVDNVSDPHVNSNGTAIVFSKDTPIGGGVSRTFLYIYHVATAAITSFTSPTLPDVTSGPVPGDYDAHWSPDRTKIATVRIVSTGLWKIVIIPVGAAPTYTPGTEVLIEPPGSNTSFCGVPEWSSDGVKLVTWFTDPQNRAANGIYWINADLTGGWIKIPTPPQFYHNTTAWIPGGGSGPTAGIITCKQGFVIFPAIPTNAGGANLPTISGTAQEGQILTAANGTWANSPTSFTRQWKRAGTSISGATAATYTCGTADVGSKLTVEVVAINTGGNSTPVTSADTATVIAAGGGGAGPFPGQAGNPVGHTAAPGFPGSLTGMALSLPGVANGTLGNPTIVSFKDFDGGTGGIYLDASRQYIKFVGCRFQSNSLGSSNISTAGAVGIEWDYCTVCPRVALVANRPNPIWPSGGAGAGVAQQPQPLYQIPAANCYQYGFNLSTAGAGGPYTITNCDIWGGQNLITLYSTTTLIRIINTWMHDIGDQNGADGAPGGYHQDGPGYLNGGVGPTNVEITNCTIAAIANGNIIAFQGGSPSANNMTISGCFLSGGAVLFFLNGVINTDIVNNTIGSDIPYRYALVYQDYKAAFRTNGNTWSGNKFRKLAGTAPYAGSTPQWTSGQDGFFVWPDGTLNATDFDAPADSLNLGLNLSVNSVPIAA